MEYIITFIVAFILGMLSKHLLNLFYFEKGLQTFTIYYIKPDKSKSSMRIRAMNEQCAEKIFEGRYCDYKWYFIKQSKTYKYAKTKQ